MARMHCYTIPLADIPAELYALWLDRQRQDSADPNKFTSPYYHPKYSLVVGQARHKHGLDDSYLLVGEVDGQAQCLWPHQRIGSRYGISRATSIGQFLTDYQGPIHLNLATSDCVPKAFLKVSGMRYFAFNHIPAAQRAFADYAWKTSYSQLLDLRGGYTAYKKKLGDIQGTATPGVLKKSDKFRRTIERDFTKTMGPLRFTFNSLVQADFEKLLIGKGEQYIRSAAPHGNLIAIPWVRSVLAQLFSTQDADFAGQLSTLHLGDTLIAAHFGIRTDTLLHYWFPWYDPAYGKYAPGLILLNECAQAAAAQGIQAIDLGRGEQAFKLRFRTDSIPLLEGAVTRPQLLGAIETGYWKTRWMIRDSAFGKKIQTWRGASPVMQADD